MREEVRIRHGRAARTRAASATLLLDVTQVTVHFDQTGRMFTLA